MPTKPLNIKKIQQQQKQQQQQQNQTKVATPDIKKTKKKKSTATTQKVKPIVEKIHKSNKKAHLKKKKSLFRKLLSFIIISYFSYYVFIGCGSPFDTNTDKPAICEPIDTIKLDLLSLFETDYYKNNINPYVEQYGAPIQKVSQGLYNNVKTHSPKIQAVYDKSISPRVNEFLSKPIIIEKRKQINDIYDTQLRQFQHHYRTTQNVIRQKYHQLPLPIQKKIMQLQDVWHQAENTDLKPILIKYYWMAIDFHQDQFKPFVVNHKYYKQSVEFMNNNPHTQQLNVQYQQHVQPTLTLLTQKFHLTQLWNHILTLLPQRSPVTTTTTASATEQKPILSQAYDSIKETFDKMKQVPDNNNIVSKAFDSIKEKLAKQPQQEEAQDIVVVNDEKEVFEVHAKEPQSNVNDKKRQKVIVPPPPLNKMEEVEEQDILL